jgi:osmotically-inducible protein OsmY
MHMKNLKFLVLVTLSLTSLNACMSTEVREPAAVAANITADEVNYNTSTSCTQVEADIEKWIAKAGPNTGNTLAETIVTKAADRCVSILNEAGKSKQLTTKKQDCSSLPQRSVASVTDDLILSQCIISAGVATEKGL